MTKSSSPTRKTQAKAPVKAAPAKTPLGKAPAKAPAKNVAKSPAAAATKTATTKPAGAEATALKKRELFERVKARSAGVKGKDVRVVMDAMLEELGAVLVEGKGLNARPLGTLKVQKHNVQPGADVVVCKLRRKKPGAAKKEPLAAAGE